MISKFHRAWFRSLCLFILVSSVYFPQPSCATEEKIALVNISAGPAALQEPDAELYKIKILTGRFCTNSGTARNYTLYVPEKSSLLPHPPFPLLVLVHGFLMTGYQHSNNARYFAERGFVVLTPDMTKILLGDHNRMRNVDDILQQMGALLNQSTTKGSPLYGLVDAGKVGIAGNSAGGAVCLEMVLQAQKANIPIHSMCSLDGVPWDRTKPYMEKLKPLNILSLRAEPGLCNYYSRIIPYLELLKFPYNDIKINGAHHCDVENPTTIGCRCVCGTSNATNRALFQKLTYLFFRDSLQANKLAGAPCETFIEAVKDLTAQGSAIANLNQLQPIQLAGTGKLQ